MYRALELAYLGRGRVSPNPMVGCVLVQDGKIIGEGWHRNFGGPHAEVNAVNHVADSDKIKGSEVYVTLEPCSHHGKTPPCADLLIKHGVKSVYISNQDIHPKVAGGGIKKLKDADIEVNLGICEDEGRNLNKRFFTFHSQKRPYIILKWAQTIDRFIARKNFDSKWISNEYSRQLVHKWRAVEDAVMVGANTGFYDNPRLDVRDWNGYFTHPVRIAVDPNLRIPSSHAVYDGGHRTLIYNYSNASSQKNLQLVRLKKDNFLQEIMKDLHGREIQSVIVEGGSYLINSLIAANLWDEARIFVSDKTFGSGIKAPDLYGAELIERKKVFDDELLFFKHINGGRI
jgi:diaminohydroxyphosphoribosylaminopyrimidine deaminase/5-amino-6-(5-phosphoribosylamino)uracil reductase